MFTRYFSVAEANACIPELEKILKQLQGLVTDMEEKTRRLRDLKEEARRRGEPVDAATFLQPEAELDFLKIVARSLIQRISEMGALLQDIRSGLVDFPAKLGGQDVMLCWRIGEPEVRYYHGLTDVGRRPLPAASGGAPPASDGDDDEVH